MSYRKLDIGPMARKDIRHILRSTRQRWGEDQCAKYKAQIEDSLEHLVYFPGIGREQDYPLTGLRAMLVGEHVVYYRDTGDKIEVARVLHVRMDPKAHFAPQE